MLNIKVWCLPKMKQVSLKRLFDSIIAEVTGIQALYDAGYKKAGAILVLFVPDSMEHGLGLEILIEVSGLNPGAESARDVRARLAAKLGGLFQEKFPRSKIVCRVPAPRPEDVEFVG